MRSPQAVWPEAVTGRDAWALSLRAILYCSHGSKQPHLEVSALADVRLRHSGNSENRA